MLTAVRLVRNYLLTSIRGQPDLRTVPGLDAGTLGRDFRPVIFLSGAGRPRFVSCLLLGRSAKRRLLKPGLETVAHPSVPHRCRSKSTRLS